jgi:methylated-DNA-[protein]-cysteine S-methyltransferase
MSKDCLTEETLLALLAGDASWDDWREHIDACPSCRRLRSRQEPLQRVLDTAPNEAELERLAGAARARLEEALAGKTRPVARYGTLSRSPVGQLFLAVSDRGLCAISLRSTEVGFVRRLERRGFRPLRAQVQVEGPISQLREYFAGRRRRFDVAVDLAGQTQFQRLVLETTAAVPLGQVVSYGEVARRIGRPRAARAVGGALSQNPVPIVVPCHRVLDSEGRLHGYGGGLDAKEKLLRLEGAPIGRKTASPAS